MKKNLLIFCTLIVSLFFISSQKDAKVTPLPKVQIRQSISKRMESLHISIQSFENTLSTKVSHEKRCSSFLNLRKHFKTIEYIISYVDPQLYTTYLNGAPLPKIMKKVPDMSIIKPCGLQRMEELIYSDEYCIDEIREHLVSFKQKLTSISSHRLKLAITDSFVFEAARFGLIRLNAHGVTGFDSPGNTEKAIDEAYYFFQGLCDGIGTYNLYMKSSQSDHFLHLKTLGGKLLTNQHFETFNRLEFLRKVINPLWKLTLEIQRHLKIELPNLHMKLPIAVNYESENLFADDFFNIAFYADFINDPRLKKRVELGKVLFFDPVLSNNNDRACASCHRPDHAFSEKLPKSLTTNTLLPSLRNAPTIINSIYATRYFHDLRAERFSQQMDHVVLNPEEFNSSYNKIVQTLNGSPEYLNHFREAYGELGITKYTITNSMSAYMSSLRSFNSEFDQYVRGELTEINPSVIRGYNLFSGKAACATCHFSPTFNGVVPPDFTETETEVLGVPDTPKAPYNLDKDLGRIKNGIIREATPFYANA
ncbi:MAG: cytochrome-c peroxidase, partial [Crocinitomicaceae bacterium]|nr:cytochrome-c peroxidase [Crocinitomicaceae bacterium]